MIGLARRDLGPARATIVAMTSRESVSYPFAGTVIRIDEATLREEPADSSALRAWCREHPRDPRAVSGLRLLDRLEEAEALGRELLKDPSITPLQRSSRRARLAQVLQWQGRYAEADSHYATAAEETGFEDPVAAQPLLLLASVLQHRATSRFEQSQREAAAEHGDPARVSRLHRAAAEDAHRALAIRTGCGAPAEQMASALQTLRRLTGHAGRDTSGR